jgi:Transposase DDE domain group 1
LVRDESRRLRVWPGAQFPAGGSARHAARAGQGAVRALGQAGAGVPRLLVLHAQQLEPDTACRRQRRADAGRANPRFVVTSLKRTPAGYDARALYEDLYCARGEAENRIGEQFELFADRASSATMAAKQLRMWFSAMAYGLVDTLRRVGLRHTQFADAAAQTIRLKLLRLGAQVRISARRVYFAIASGCPNQAEFALAHIRLQRTFSSD